MINNRTVLRSKNWLTKSQKGQNEITGRDKIQNLNFIKSDATKIKKFASVSYWLMEKRGDFLLVEKCLCNDIWKWLDFLVSSDKNDKP